MVSHVSPKFGVAFARTAFEDLPALGQKFPHLPMLLQFELQHAKARIPYHAIRLPSPEACQILPARSNYKLSNSALRVGGALRILWRETFILMRMTVQYQVRTGTVQIAPKRPDLNRTPMPTGCKQRPVPERQCA